MSKTTGPRDKVTECGPGEWFHTPLDNLVAWISRLHGKRKGSPMKNIGNIDRALRIVVGLAVISLVFWGPRTAWGWIGVIPIAIALIGWCPLYTVLGIRTCPVKHK